MTGIIVTMKHTGDCIRVLLLCHYYREGGPPKILGLLECIPLPLHLLEEAFHRLHHLGVSKSQVSLPTCTPHFR